MLMMSKIIICLMLFSVTNTFAKQAFSQLSQISINIKKSNLENVLKQIRKESDYTFFYSAKDVENITIEKIKIKFSSIKNVLNILLENTNLKYSIEDKVVVISLKNNQIKKQQEKYIVKGKVVDNKGESLPGVTVLIKGTIVGVTTNMDGEFSISVDKKPNTILRFSFIGMKTFEQVLKFDGQPLKIILTEDAKEIDEVVVNGVFERKANTFTGSVTTIKKEDLQRVSNSNVLESLKNLDPSIMFVDNMSLGSDPNARPEMILRGKSSIQTGDVDLKAMYQTDPNAPLFVLDGFEVSIQKIMDLDMDRVESLTILKDASAKAIYGAKAANGVIVIELKKNTSGELRLRYNISLNIEAPDLTSYDLCNAAEKLDVEKAYGMYYDPEAGYNSQRMMSKMYNQKLTAVKSGIDTDWLSKPLELGVGTKHSLSVELGDRELRAIIDLSYNGIKGVMKGSDRTNISGGFSLSYRTKKFLFRNQLTITSNEANDSKYGTFSDYARLNPYYTPYDQYGNISENIVPILESPNDVYVASWYKDVTSVTNPLFDAQLDILKRNKYTDITNNFSIKYYFTKNLNITSSFGLTSKKNTKDLFYPSDCLKFKNYSGEDAYRKGEYTYGTGNQNNLSGKFDISYNIHLGEKGMLYSNTGFNLSNQTYTTNTQKAEGFPSDKMNDIMFARQYAKDTKPTGTEQTKRDFGYYLSANYSFDDRINFDGTFRQSASSIYGADSRWGVFWSLGGSWNIHNEKCMENSGFDKLRLRATMGSTVLKVQLLIMQLLLMYISWIRIIIIKLEHN